MSEEWNQRFTRVMVMRRECERLMSGRVFRVHANGGVVRSGGRDFDYEVCVIDHRKWTGDARSISARGLPDPQLQIKGIPVDELAALVGCSCGQHPINYDKLEKP